MLKRSILALLVVLSLTTLIAVPAAHAWSECGEVVCVGDGDCGYGCFCVFYDDVTKQYRGFILYQC